MRTKKDYWIQLLMVYVFLTIAFVILFQFKGYHLFAIPFIGLAFLWIFKAVKIFRSLDDKNIYPKKLNFLNLFAKWSLEAKRFKYVFLISILFGAVIGYFLVLYYL